MDKVAIIILLLSALLVISVQSTNPEDTKSEQKTTADASTSTSTEVRIYNTDGKLIKQEIPHILPKVVTCNKKGKSVKSTIMQLVLTIGQHYYLGLSLMGSGGFGKVYMGYDVIERRCVAIKVVNMEVGELDDEEIETMKKEPIIQQRFAGNPHSHVVQLYNPIDKIDDEKKTFYMVMELASGSFDKLLESVKEKDRAAIIVRAWNQMLPAVKEIHEKGIMHMDLKPENFLVFHHPDAKEPTDFDLKMSDFGIAMDLPADKVVHTQLSFKDVRIASPEQVVCAEDLENSNRHWLWGYKPLSWIKQDDSIDKVPSFLHKITPKVDIWGLGMCLHIMMYGSGPYAVHIPADVHTLMTQPGFHIVPMAYKDNPKLYNIVKSCLQIDADARPTIQKLLSEEYKVSPKVTTPKNEKSAENATKNDKN